MGKLNEMQCVPCMGGVPPLDGQDAERLLTELNGWELAAAHHLKKSYAFPDFQAALDFVNRVGRLAEQEGHHPDINFGWGYAELKIWTHKIDGLTESDFILASKIDAL